MITRPARLSDAPRIAEAHVRAWQVAYAEAFPAEFLNAIDLSDWTARRRGHLKGLIPPAGIYVVENGADLCGFTHVGPARFDDDERRDSRIGEVYAIYVDPRHWSIGAGFALMRTGVAHLTGAGCREIRLWVLAANARARGFYERFGFRDDGVEKMFTLDRGGRFETRAPEARYSLPVR